MTADDLQVWRVRLDPPDDLLSERESTLSADERARADRFRTDILRRRFIAGRGALRAILGERLGIAPGRVAFVYGAHGKPALAGPNPSRVEFNLAHSHDLALCAVTTARAVGIDVEALRPLDGPERIIARFFSPAEQREFLGHAEPDRLAAFFRGWTRKEAFLKATGKGLGGGLDSFDVTLDVSRAALLRVAGDPDAPRRWRLLDLDAGPGFAASVAVEGRLNRLIVSDWDGPASSTAAVSEQVE